MSVFALWWYILSVKNEGKIVDVEFVVGEFVGCFGEVLDFIGVIHRHNVDK